MSFIKCAKCGHEFKDLEENKYATVTYDESNNIDAAICPACSIWINGGKRMTHKALFDIYKMLLGGFLGSVDTWFPNGKNSIRVRLTTRQEVIFTYTNDKKWRIETVDMFLGGK